MKVLFMAKESYFSLNAINFMLQHNIKIEFAVLRTSDKLITKICEDNNILYGSEEDLCTLYDDGKINADWLFSFYWKLAKPKTLSIAEKGSINFHPGPLPEAKGYSYHRAILEQWGYYGITAHYMSKEFDTGDIIECRRFSIPNDIVSIDLVKMTHEQLFILFSDLVSRIMQGEELHRGKQTGGQYTSFKQMEAAKHILPEDDEECIARKIRAFWNPPYTGAQISLGGKNYTVIDELILNWIAAKTLNQ